MKENLKCFGKAFIALPLLYCFQANAQVLPPKLAFPYTIEVTPENVLVVHWSMVNGYYLYGDKFSVHQDGVRLPISVKEKPELKHDKYFGETYIFKYNATVFSQLDGVGPVEVTYQGCADALLCYPLETISLIDDH